MAITIDINGKCNERCAFCYQNLDGSVLPIKKILELIDSSDGVVQIGGGEPFIDDRIIDIIRFTRSKGRNMHISTNATIIPKGLLGLDEETRAGVQVQASVHASNRNLYERITGRDLFERVVENIETIKEFYSTLISSAIYKENLHDVANLVSLAERLGVPIRITPVFPEGSGRNVKLMNDNEIDQLRGYLLVQRIMKGRMIDSPLIHVNNCGALEAAYGIEKKAICPVDCASKLYVSPRGEEYRCEFLRHELTLNGERIGVKNGNENI